MYDHQDTTPSLLSESIGSLSLSSGVVAAEDEHCCVLETFDVDEQRALLERIEREQSGSRCSASASESSSEWVREQQAIWEQVHRQRSSESSQSTMTSQDGQSSCYTSASAAPASESSSELVREQQAILEAIQRQQQEEAEEMERLRRQCQEEEEEALRRSLQNAESSPTSSERSLAGEDSFQLQLAPTTSTGEESDARRGELRRRETERLRASCADETAELLRRQYSEEVPPPAPSAPSSSSPAAASSRSRPRPRPPTSSLSPSFRSSRRRDVLRSMREQGDGVSSSHPRLSKSLLSSSSGSSSLRGSGIGAAAACTSGAAEGNATLLEVYSGQSIRVVDRRETVLKSDTKKNVKCGGCSQNFFVSRGCKILYCPECETLTPTSLGTSPGATAA